MDTKQLYAKKLEVYQKALNREEGDWMPTAMFNNGAGFFYGGKTPFDFADDDHEGYARALNSFLDEMYVDVCCISGQTSKPLLSNTFITAENRLAADGTLTHLQLSPMKADEYDQLIADIKGFMANVLLPRKYPYLFEDREKTKELLKIYAEGMLDTMVVQMGENAKYIAEQHGVPSVMNMGAMINTPLDHLFDYFRGFKGTLTDLRRQKDKVKEALDVIWEYKCAEVVAKPYDPSQGLVFQPCHIPAYLSPKQYEELYWPYEKRYADWIAENGGKIFLILEGKWGPLADWFREAPKDSYVLAVDDDDTFDIYERFGDCQIICGGLRLADTRLKAFEAMKDDIKKVVDTCAPGGGFLFMSDKAFVTPGDVNKTLIECYNFAHEYSMKK